MVKLCARSRTYIYGDLIVKTGGRKGLQGGISTNKTTIRSFLSSNDPNNTDFVFEFFQSISKSNGNNPKLKMLFLKADVACVKTIIIFFLSCQNDLRRVGCVMDCLFLFFVFFFFFFFLFLPFFLHQSIIFYILYI